MAGNHFDTNVIVDDGIGSIATPGASVGFGVDPANTTIPLGPRISCGTGSPVGAAALETYPLGSIWIQTDASGLFIVTVAGPPTNTWTAITIP